MFFHCTSNYLIKSCVRLYSYIYIYTYIQLIIEHIGDVSTEKHHSVSVLTD